MWHADFDPGTLRVRAVPTRERSVGALMVSDLTPWLTVMTGIQGAEHIVLSDGYQHLRLDVLDGRIADQEAVVLHIAFEGLDMARAGVPSLQRLLSLIAHRRFLRSLYPRDPAVTRGLEVLRVHDALAQGATQREIAGVLFGQERVGAEWNGLSDALRSRVRRLVREARAMAGGRYRSLMRRAARVAGHQAQS